MGNTGRHTVAISLAERMVPVKTIASGNNFQLVAIDEAAALDPDQVSLGSKLITLHTEEPSSGLYTSPSVIWTSVTRSSLR